MFEGFVASLLNRYLGKYVEDLDLDKLNVGIFSGNVVLENLILKPEALYELGLPIFVKLGTVGKLTLNIPWSRLCNQTSVITVEEVFILATPATTGKYKADLEKRLQRAEKKRILSKLNPSGSFLSSNSPDSFVETLITSILNSLRVYIHNVHLRYEDDFTNNNLPVAVGFCLHSLSVENTNSKWKPISHSSKMGSIYQVVKVESLSFYCNASCKQLLINDDTVSSVLNCNWINCMRRSLETFSLNGESFDFTLKPISARLKVIINKSSEAQILKLLIDFVLQDVALQLSHQQYLALVQLKKSFRRISVNRLSRKFQPEESVKKNTRNWWRYAFESISHNHYHPYTWSHILSHRKNYQTYCALYEKVLLEPSNSEIKMDLQQIEDSLNICNIIMAQEQTKLKMREHYPEKIVLEECAPHSSCWSFFDVCSKRLKLCVRDKRNMFWNQLSSPEKDDLFEVIGYKTRDEYRNEIDRSKHYIEHKVNVTVANLSLSLVSGGSETLVIGISHLLSSLETKPATRTYKVSTRIEGMAVEGASVEYNLIPIITSENILNGDHHTNFLVFDFEKNPSNSEVDYSLSIYLESLELIYHEFSVSSFASFLRTPNLSLESAMHNIYNKIKNLINRMARNSVSRRYVFQINVDMKLPHVVFPERGSFQNNGNVLIFDLGRLKIWSDLQLGGLSLEDATQSELEEKLYDRFHFSFTDFQILIFDYDQDWKNFKKVHSSQYHIVSKINSQVVFSNNVKPENNQLPRYKLNVTLQKFKINMSDSRITNLFNFFKTLPRPKSYTVLDIADDFLILDSLQMKGAECLYQLEQIQHTVISNKIMHAMKKCSKIKEEKSVSFLDVNRTAVSSEISDEDSDLWAQILDLPGLDDNVSQNNAIIYLFRVHVVQVILDLKRSCNNIDQPYLVIQASNFCFDIAFMEYGPAVQVSLESFTLVDKQHFLSSMSNQLQLIDTEGKPEVLTIMYRKVASDCPDFKTHFHNVEQSLVIGIHVLNFTIHRESCIHLYRYLQYFFNKFENRHIAAIKNYLFDLSDRTYNVWFKSNEPPIPAGATKFSYSIRLLNLKVHMCDAEIDFLSAKVSGFELDCLFKANDRFVLRTFLHSVGIDDISNMTMYPQILTVEEEIFLEVKYVRRAVKLRKSNIDSNVGELKSDGNFRIYMGRVHFVLIAKLIQDVQKFFAPFISVDTIVDVARKIKYVWSKLLSSIRFCTNKIHLSIECQLPTFLLPQQSSSPNLMVFSTGDFTAENLFNELYKYDCSHLKNSPLIDNILIKLDGLSLARAIVDLNGTIIVQETIMDPVCCKMDVKRLLINNQPLDESETPTFDINFVADKAKINLSQKDFSSLYFIWIDNIKKFASYCQIQQDVNQNSSADEEESVLRLQEFFYQSEGNRREMKLHMNFEGLTLQLYTDIEELLSSPVRDENRSLCQFEIGEVLLHGQYYVNGRVENQLSVQSLLLEDTRVLSNISIRRIFQSYGATNVPSNNENVSITVPPVISVTLKKNQSGEGRCDVLIDHTRINLGVSFLTDLFRFVIEAIPFEQENTENISGMVNYGYMGESLDDNKINEELCDGRFSNSLPDENAGLTMSVTCRKPEIMFFSSVHDRAKSHALLLRSDLSIEYIKHPTNISFIFHINDLHLLSKLQSKLVNTPSNVVLQPCNVEISKHWTSVSNETKISATCDKIDLHISASTVCTIANIIQELDSYFFTEVPPKTYESCDNFCQDLDDLWAVKKIPPYYLPHKYESTQEPSIISNNKPEIMIICLPIISLMFEIEDLAQKKPVLLFKMRSEAKLKNWSTSLELKGDLSLQCSYYNCTINAWEPVIEPTVKINNVYCPWEISVKAFKSKSYPISTVLGCGKSKCDSSSKKRVSDSILRTSVKRSVESETSADEDKPIRKTSRSASQFSLKKDRTNVNYSDSESENEDTVMEKLKTKFNQLLTGTSSDENVDSDSDISVDEFSNENSEHSDNDSIGYTTNNSFLLEKRDVFITKQKESADSGLDSENYDKSATYLILEARERFEVVITPNTISVVKQILDSFSLKFNNVLSDTQCLSLKNDIAPYSTVTLRSKTTRGGSKVLMRANYNLNDSSPSSRNSTAGTPCNFDDDSDLEFQSGIETFEGGFAADAYSQSDHVNRKLINDISIRALQFPQVPVDIFYSKVVDRQLHISVPGFEDLTIICPIRTTNKCHALQPSGKNRIKYYLIISVVNDLWGQMIVVRSPLQIKNETCYALSLYYKKNDLEQTGFDHIGELTNPFEESYKFAIVEPDEVYNVPIAITYHCSIYVLPVYEDYQLSEVGLWWKDILCNLVYSQDIVCKPKDDKAVVFVSRAVTCKGVKLSHCCPTGLPNLMIRLLPSVVIYNLLPCAFNVKIPNANFTIRIEAGGKSSVYSLDMNIRHTASIEVPTYFGITWTGSFNLCSKLEEKLITLNTDQDSDGGNKHLCLNVKLDKSDSQNVMIYSPYWIINKTGLPLQLKGSAFDVVYETFAEEPLFFSFRKTQKKTVRLRIYDSSWSSSFSIDTTGCSGLITCRDKERNRSYHIIVETSFSQLNPQTTKIVTLLPYFLLSNQCKLPIRYMEENEQADLWVDLPPNQTTPFWPETNSMKMFVKYKDSSFVSQHFRISEACRTVLRMDKGSALVADVTGGDNNPYFIVFRNYVTGDAPVRIDNFCDDLFLKIFQEGLGQVTLLSPYQSLLYTWDDPTTDRKLQWNVYNRKSKGFTVNYKVDGHGQEFVSFELIKQQTSNSSSKSNKLSSSLKKLTAKYSADGVNSSSSGEELEKENGGSLRTHKGKVIVFWVSYLEGSQRVILFTQDEQVAFYAYSRIDSERSRFEMFLSVVGMGMSLVHRRNNCSKELAYISMTDSASIWEVNIAHTWKILPLELATWIEHQWSQGIKRAQLKDYVNVDLDKMQFIKPFFGELRRSYYPALWLHFRKSFNYFYIQCKIHHFQIDNQIPNSTFETILYSKVVSYDVIRKYGLKPSIEGIILKKRDTDYEKNVYKYVKLALLPFCVQVDKQFIVSVYELIQPWIRAQNPSLRIRADICKVHHPLSIKFNNENKSEREAIVEYLYFSPFKIQFKFVPQNVINLSNDVYDQSYFKTALHFVLHYTSPNYISCKGIKLKCPFFEESGIITRIIPKMKQIRRHYMETLLQQLYSQILKVNVPSHTNSDRDLGDGEYVDQYYDLSVTRFKKVEEFADAISGSARSLLSHVCSASANANSTLITCSKRTSLDLGLNPEIIKKKSITPKMSFEEPEEVLRGNFSFDIGVVHGLSGVHLSIATESQQNGVELFFKTTGRHLLKLLNKYQSTIYNMPLAAIDGVKRAAETGTDVVFMKRLPKHINPFGMTPYSTHHAIGLHLLNSISKGIYAETDCYWSHVILTPEGRSCLLFTFEHIFFLTKQGTWDEWKIQWLIIVNDILEVPQICKNKLLFKIRQDDDGNDDRCVEHQDLHILYWIQKMIEIVFIINLEGKPYFFESSLAMKA